MHFMERSKRRPAESPGRILLLVAAFGLLCLWHPGFSGEARAAAGFNPADYTLRGVTSIGTPGGPARSFAVIESVKTGKQGLYRVGDTLSGALITRISRNSVTLVVEHREHRLFVETSTPAATSTAPSSPPGPTPASAPPDAGRPMPPQQYVPPGPLAPELTHEEVLKNIEQEQREQPR